MNNLKNNHTNQCKIKIVRDNNQQIYNKILMMKQIILMIK